MLHESHGGLTPSSLPTNCLDKLGNYLGDLESFLDFLIAFSLFANVVFTLLELITAGKTIRGQT